MPKNGYIIIALFFAGLGTGFLFSSFDQVRGVGLVLVGMFMLKLGEMRS